MFFSDRPHARTFVHAVGQEVWVLVCVQKRLLKNKNSYLWTKFTISSSRWTTNQKRYSNHKRNTFQRSTCSLIEDDTFPYQETKFTDKNSGYTNLYSTLFGGNFHGNHAASVWNEHSYSTRTMHGLGNRLGLRLRREVHRVVRLAYAISCSVRSTNVQYMYSVRYSTVHVQVVHVLYAVVHTHWLYCGCAVLRRSRACACTRLCVMGDRSASVKSWF